jgi:hypothetical protein
MPSVSWAYGLFDGENIVGCVTYGKPASNSLCVGLAGKENSKLVYELNRLVITTDIPNSASFLVGRSLKMLPKPLYVVSYADDGWGHKGYVYQATNWIYTGMTKPRTDIYSQGHSRHHCGDITKRQKRSGKHRYVYLIGNKKKMLETLNYAILPYPKGDSVHYDIDKPVPVDKELIKD